MPAGIAKSIRKKLNEIAVDPFKQRNDVSPLQGRPGYRLKSGAWRVIYKFESDRLEILVIKIASGGDVYK